MINKVVKQRARLLKNAILHLMKLKHKFKERLEQFKKAAAFSQEKVDAFRRDWDQIVVLDQAIKACVHCEINENAYDKLQTIMESLNRQ